MALTLANECRAAALNGITALLNGGDFRLLNSADAQLAKLTLASTAFGSASTASPSVATSGVVTKDAAPTAGTVAKFQLRTSGAQVRINGTVGTSGADLIVTDPVIPAQATEVTCTGGLTLTLQLS